MSVADMFRRAVDNRDEDAIMALFSDDVRFFTPVKFRPFEGVVTVRAVLRVLLRTFDDFHYFGQLAGQALERDGGPETESHILLFRAAVSGRQLHGIDLLQVDEHGRISTFTVMIRPLSALITLSEAVSAGLAESGGPGPEQ